MRRLLYKTFFAFSLGLILPQIVFAAQVFFDAKTTQAQMGEKFEVKLLVNTEQESINAFEGKMVFPGNILDLKEIRDGNTIVNFWIEKPKNQNGVITFSGVTPGGFNDEKGSIFSAVFEARKEGVVKFAINDARVLRNDGIGSEATWTVAPFEVAIIEGVSAEITALSNARDRRRPESFVPEIARDQNIFGGKRFLAFATQDKGLGMSHYEIKETRQRLFTLFSRWRVAESPYVLEDQELRSYIFMKAVDNMGNKTTAHIYPHNPLAWYENYENWIMITGGFFIVAFVTRKVWRKKYI